MWNVQVARLLPLLLFPAAGRYRISAVVHHAFNGQAHGVMVTHLVYPVSSSGLPWSSWFDSCCVQTPFFAFFLAYVGRWGVTCEMSGLKFLPSL